LATDAAGMQPEGAYWIYDRDEGRWLFFLVTSLFHHIGPRHIFGRINKILSEVFSESEARDFVYYVTSPEDEIVKKIMANVRTGTYSTTPWETEVDVTGQKTPVVVYRMCRGMTDNQAKSARRRFGRFYRALVTA
jgi:hypothetical protein